MSEQIKLHPFVRTLGDGPYQFKGMGQIVFDKRTGTSYHGPHVSEGAGTCAHCGMAIMNIMVVENGAKKTFGVGSSCVEKLYNGGVVSEKFLSEAKRALLAKQREQRKKRNLAAARKREEKKAAENKEAKEFVQSADLSVFKSKPHPNDYFASQGKTFADYIQYFVDRWDYIKAKQLIEKGA